MPPRAAFTTSFSVSDASNEVVCPLENHDGSSCRKRCFGEKRYRSMQEHIRRAHPDYYIPKLPATEESFNLMVKSAVSKEPQMPNLSHSSTNVDPSSSTYDSKPFFSPERTSANTSPTLHQNIRRPSMLPAATALAQLHNSRPEDWQDQDAFAVMDDNSYLQNYFVNPAAADTFAGVPAEDTSPPIHRDIAPSSLQRALSSRGSSLQPLFKSRGHRPRKSSLTESARRPKHERDRSKDLKRVSLGYDRKTLSAEPSSGLGNKWEDLLDAAASATEADSRDLTPIPQSPRSSTTPFQVPQLPSLQSYAASPLQNSMIPQSPDADHPSFTAPHLEPFPSVEGPTYDPQHHDPTSTGVQQSAFQHHLHHSSNDSSNPFSAYPRASHQHRSSGSSFHIPSSILSSSPNQNLSLTNNTSHSTNNNAAYPVQYSPIQPSQHYSPVMSQHGQSAPAAGSSPLNPPLVEHYCAACHRVAPLNSSYACTECICGICRDCVDVLVGMGPERGARCPRCNVVGGRFKPFMLDLR